MKLRGPETQTWGPLPCMFIKLFTAEISQKGILSDNRYKARMKVSLILKERSSQRGLRKKGPDGEVEEHSVTWAEGGEKLMHNAVDSDGLGRDGL